MFSYVAYVEMLMSLLSLALVRGYVSICESTIFSRGNLGAAGYKLEALLLKSDSSTIQAFHSKR